MKLVSYYKDEQDQLAIFSDGLLYDTDLLHPDLPVSMAMFLNYWEDIYPATAAINEKLVNGKISRKQGIDYDAADVLPPVPHPTSCRSLLSFRPPSISETGETLALPGHDRYPVFYFANHHCLQSGGDVVCMPDHLKKLDFELKVAVVICKAGKNISAEDADNYIGGYMIMNDITARLFPGTETANYLSANGRGFATAAGPVLVTRDELEAYRVENKPGHTGSTYNLPVKCYVNDVQVSEGNLADMDWTFAEIIEQASYGVQLFPGDIISGAPAGIGSFLELNAAGRSNDPGYEEQWLKEGDVIEVEIEALGKLGNNIVKDQSGDAPDKTDG